MTDRAPGIKVLTQTLNPQPSTWDKGTHMRTNTIKHVRTLSLLSYAFGITCMEALSHTSTNHAQKTNEHLRVSLFKKHSATPLSHDATISSSTSRRSRAGSQKICLARPQPPPHLEHRTIWFPHCSTVTCSSQTIFRVGSHSRGT